MVKKNILICVDRDGTLIFDDKYYLGRTNGWKRKVKILKNVISGLKLINAKLPAAKLFMITNQPGIAITDFPLLTQKRDHEVNKYVLKQLARKGAKIKGYIFSPYASPIYVKNHPQYHFDKKYVEDSPLNKPHAGMVYAALKRSDFSRNNTNIYVIGDRANDALTALNIGGHGIVIPFVKTHEEIAKVRRINNKRLFIAKDFLAAARFIIKNELS